jgi:hypothetical protein
MYERDMLTDPMNGIKDLTLFYVPMPNQAVIDLWGGMRLISGPVRPVILYQVRGAPLRSLKGPSKAIAIQKSLVG